MRTAAVLVVLSIWPGLVMPAASAAAQGYAPSERPGTTIEWRIERLADTGRNLADRFTPAQLAILEKLNRADAAHLRKLVELVVPLTWHDDELRYSPFPHEYPSAAGTPKLLVVNLPWQAFAAYEYGTLVRWGPVSSGKRSSQTPSGVFTLNWRSRGRHSTVDPDWFMEWYFNFHNTGGLALHQYGLPGRPASHACLRLLERDAIWLFDWGEGAGIRSDGMRSPGTPLIIEGQYAFDAPPPWRSPEALGRGIDLPRLPEQSVDSAFNR